jgi:hypothetical protein
LVFESNDWRPDEPATRVDLNDLPVPFGHPADVQLDPFRDHQDGAVGSRRAFLGLIL